MYAHTYICGYVYTYIYIYMYIHMDVSLSLSIYIYIYIYPACTVNSSVMWKLCIRVPMDFRVLHPMIVSKPYWVHPMFLNIYIYISLYTYLFKHKLTQRLVFTPKRTRSTSVGEGRTIGVQPSDKISRRSPEVRGTSSIHSVCVYVYAHI